MTDRRFGRLVVLHSYKDNYLKKNLRRSLTAAGITLEQYESILAAQDGLCAICGNPPNGQGRLHIDHDHETGMARGLLCSNCNPGLGYFKDDPERLRLAIEYLERCRERNVEPMGVTG